MKANGKEITEEGVELTVCGSFYHVSRQGKLGQFTVVRSNRSKTPDRRVFRSEKTLVDYFRKVGIKC